MIQLNCSDSLQAWRQTLNGQLALVPTMGNLHRGHLSLIETAKRISERVLVSIYVNPRQFSAHEDLHEYPRTLVEDLRQLQALEVDAVFVPNDDTIYADSSKNKSSCKKYDLLEHDDLYQMGQRLCGKSRPHFFTGVINVVGRLFDLIEPDVAVFGEKDYQQLQIVTAYTHRQFPPISIIPSAIIREHSGLAMSSRNQYLNGDQLEQAAQLFQQLNDSKTQLKRYPKKVHQILLKAIERLQKDFMVDYYCLANDVNFLPINELADPQHAGHARLFAAVFLQGDERPVRLIDNLVL